MTKLKEIREKNNLSQSQLAEQIDTSIRTLQAYEQGQRDFVGAKLETILKACITLKCSLKDMFEDDGIFNLIEKYEKQQ
jgi:transcriptional regulator with XRE-family HTH domain